MKKSWLTSKFELDSFFQSISSCWQMTFINQSTFNSRYILIFFEIKRINVWSSFHSLNWLIVSFYRFITSIVNQEFYSFTLSVMIFIEFINLFLIRHWSKDTRNRSPLSKRLIFYHWRQRKWRRSLSEKEKIKLEIDSSILFLSGNRSSNSSTQGKLLTN